MSRFEKEAGDLQNPAERYFKWSADSSDGATGNLQYYDRDTKTNINVPLPFTFFPLDKVVTVGGGTKGPTGYVGYWSNAVKNPATQKLVVRSKAGIVAEGFWVKGDLKGTDGMKYTTGLYIGFMDDYDGEMKLGYLKLQGSSLTAWIEFTKEHKNIYEGGFVITDKTEKRKNGATTYYTPTFDTVTASETELEDLLRIYGPLSKYLKAYFAKGVDDTDESDEDENGVEKEQELEFSGPADRDIHADFYADNTDGPNTNENNVELVVICQELNKLTPNSWTPGKLKEHVQEQFDKPLGLLDEEEMNVLIADMAELLNERKAMAEESKPKAKAVANAAAVADAPKLATYATPNQISTLRRLLDIKDMEEKAFLLKADNTGETTKFEQVTEEGAKAMIKALGRL